MRIALGRYARNNENFVLVFDTDGLVLAEKFGKSYEYVRLKSSLEIYVVLAKCRGSSLRSRMTKRGRGTGSRETVCELLRWQTLYF